MVKAAVLACVMLIAGCAGDRYRTEPLPAEPERGAVVEAVRTVPLSDRAGSYIGAVIGGGVGATAGSTVGSGRGSQAATVAGAVAGTIEGSMLGGSVRTREGSEITVRLDSGRQLIVLQPEGETFTPGERVRVIAGPQGSRVTH